MLIPMAAIYFSGISRDHESMFCEFLLIRFYIKEKDSNMGCN